MNNNDNLHKTVYYHSSEYVLTDQNRKYFIVIIFPRAIKNHINSIMINYNMMVVYQCISQLWWWLWYRYHNDINITCCSLITRYKISQVHSDSTLSDQWSRRWLEDLDPTIPGGPDRPWDTLSEEVRNKTRWQRDGRKPMVELVKPYKKILKTRQKWWKWWENPVSFLEKKKEKHWKTCFFQTTLEKKIVA